MGRYAHTLKGTLLQCGLLDLAAVAETIQTSVRNGTEEPYQQLLQELQTGLVNVTLPPSEDASGAASIDQGGPA